MSEIEILNIKEEVQKIIKEETEKYVKERILMPMNKKIKVIDLVNIIANKQDIPQRIRVDKDIYNWDMEEFYKREDGKDLFGLANFYNTIGFLELEVEILEDNTEEIEELEVGKIATDERLKINELVKAVNQIRKELNK